MFFIKFWKSVLVSDLWPCFAFGNMLYKDGYGLLSDYTTGLLHLLGLEQLHFAIYGSTITSLNIN